VYKRQAHDGFTLWDTVSFTDKRNEANGEDGRDGHDHNLSDNMGVEGPTDDPGVTGSRLRRVRAMLATLMLSRGVPMLLAGDELGQTQGGNNNAYCQDNEIAWIDWSAARPGLADAVAALKAFRDEAGIAQSRFPTAPGESDATVLWLREDGAEMTPGDWEDPDRSCVVALIANPGRAPVLLCVNGGDDMTLPLPPGRWRLRIDTARDAVASNEAVEGDRAVGWQSVLAFVAEA
jgi:glycogen operon protein